MNRTQAARPFQVMTKPIGPRCNIDCKYCYYLEKEKLYPGRKKFTMPDEVLARYICDYIASQVECGHTEITFFWQGGEPTILGLDYFKRIVELQTRHKSDDIKIKNAIQTNGMLLTPEWVSFFRHNDFLVGISIDGPKEIHDRYRIDKTGRPTFDKVMRGLDLLQAGEVDYNVLTVVHRHNARKPEQIYKFLRGKGVEFMQFIPIVERSNGGINLAAVPQLDQMDDDLRVTPWSVASQSYGKFLCKIFDIWIGEDVGRIFVQFFDVQLGLWMGEPSFLCWFSEQCGQGLAMEHNGDLYACDHYVYPEYRLGNIMEAPMLQMALSDRQLEFGREKATALPLQCRRCKYKFACNGGCPKHRFLETGDGEEGLNYLCDAYTRFFEHTGGRLLEMGSLIHSGRPASDIMNTKR